MIDDELANDLDELNKELNEPSKSNRKVKKMVKKVTKFDQADTAPKKSKKVKAPAPKRTRTETPQEGFVTLRQLAQEANLAPPIVRAKLRASTVDRGDGRWKFEEGSKRLKEARQALGIS